jgi:ubiquinone/menaquinone biosynthesis C-methylase UbiE
MDTKGVAAHYTTGNLIARFEAGIAALGAEPPLDPDILAPGDEFHIGGRDATIQFMERLAPAADARILDLGSGLGGPARFVAKTYGARVTGVDLTAEYVATARHLTQMCGLSDRVELVEGSILDLPFDAATFDGAYMLHVGMNIADKARLAAEAARVLKPGGRFAIYDVMQVGEGEMDYPAPWASRAELSALARPEDYRAALTGAGFEIESETDRTDFAEAFFARLAAAQAAADGPPPLGLHLVMGSDTATKVRNMVTNIRAGRIAPIEILARAPATSG